MITRALSSAVLALTLAACGKSDEAAGSDPVTTTKTTVVAPTAADPTAKAQEIFAQRCTPCHGPEGRGDGPASAQLDPHPRNFHDAAWQKSVTDEYLAQIILVGGGAVGKSAAMPSNPDLRDEAVRAAIAKLIRELGTKP